MESNTLEITRNPDLGHEEIEIIPTHTVCRLCATQSDRLIGIFSEEGLSSDLSNKINLYLPIKVSASDALPLQCCLGCASTLLAWHELVVTSVEIDKKFRSAQLVSENVKVDGVEHGLDTSDNNPLSDDNDACDNEGLFSEIIPEEDIPLFADAEVGSEPDSDSLTSLMAAAGNIEALFEAIRRREEEEKEAKTIKTQVLEDRINEIEEVFVGEVNNAEMFLQEEEDVISKEVKPGGGVFPETGKQCEICDKILSCRPNYISHVKTHVSDFYCKICCNSYNTKFKLDTHFNSHDRSKDKKQNHVSCQFAFCTAVFPSKLQLYKHKKTHLALKSFKCDMCKMEFLKSSAFEKHKLKHETPLTCEICDKTFANKKTLKEHERLHTGEKPFKCQLCHKKFRCQSGLKYHEVSHSNERKYKCQLCPLSFTRSNYLKEHLRKHSNERPYQCKICKMKFIQMGVLSRHEKRVHAKCDICKIIVGKIKDLSEHKRKCHIVV